MNLESQRKEIIEAYRASRASLLSAIDGLSEAEMNEPAIDGWSVKQQLAHVAQWDEVRVGDLLRVDAGMKPGYARLTRELVNAFNEMGRRARDDWLLSQVLQELETTRERVLQTLAALSERGFEDARYGDVSPRGGVAHETEHAELIRRWRQNRS